MKVKAIRQFWTNSVLIKNQQLLELEEKRAQALIIMGRVVPVNQGQERDLDAVSDHEIKVVQLEPKEEPEILKKSNKPPLNTNKIRRPRRK